MTLGMVKNVLRLSEQDYLFEINEIINENTGAHYRKGENQEILLGGDPIDVTEDWLMGLPVTRISARDNHLIIMVDG